MTTYYKETEIQKALDNLIEDYLKDCRKCDQLSEGFIELIKHNFLAKFVCYDQDTKTIEIGIEDNSPDALYPKIKVYKYPLSSKKWLKSSFKSDKNDLLFYGKLINRNNSSREAEVVLM